MATLKQRLHRKNASGTYDTVHLETSADLVLMPDGITKLSDKISAMDTTIAGKAASSHGTHVTFSTTTPKAAGTAAVGSATTVSRSDHVHPAQTSVTGNAGTATKLATSRTIRTNLGSTSSANFDGSANITPGVTGTLPVANGGTGVTSIAALKDALGITTASAPSTTISVGGNVSISAFDWICVHTDANYYYLMTKYVLGLSEFGECEEYSKSLIAMLCKLFGAAIGVWGNPAFGNITVNGLSEYCFIPTDEQMTGGFNYFTSDTNRKATDAAGLATSYFTSTVKGEVVVGGGGTKRYYVRAVSTSGSIIQSNLYQQFTLHEGVRPCIALKK